MNCRFDSAGGGVPKSARDPTGRRSSTSFPHRGDFATESRAAAAGGVTSIFEMPISKPCASTADVLRARQAIAKSKAYVNIGLYGAPGRKDAAETRAMADAGAIAFKLFSRKWG